MMHDDDLPIGPEESGVRRFIFYVSPQDRQLYQWLSQIPPRLLPEMIRHVLRSWLWLEQMLTHPSGGVHLMAFVPTPPPTAAASTPQTRPRRRRKTTAEASAPAAAPVSQDGLPDGQEKGSAGQGEGSLPPAMAAIPVSSKGPQDAGAADVATPSPETLARYRELFNL